MINQILYRIDGMDENFATLIQNYINKYIEMSSNNEIVLNNIINQIQKNIKGIQIKKLDGISGCASGNASGIIILDDSLDEDTMNNTFLHEFTHIICLNTEIIENDVVDYNFGLKPSREDQADLSWGIRLKNWEIDGNNYSYNKGIFLLDEWITEWLANKMSNYMNYEIKKTERNFYRIKTSHGYDGSNVMNLLELVFGSEKIANLITGFDLTEQERHCVIPIKEIEKINGLINSKDILTTEEKNIFLNLNPPYMTEPTILGLILYYISEYQSNRNKDENLQNIMNVLVRTYKYIFEHKINETSNYMDLEKINNELHIIQNSIFWNEDMNQMACIEAYNIFNEIREQFLIKAKEKEIDISQYSDLLLNGEQMIQKFEFLKSTIGNEHVK